MLTDHIADAVATAKRNALEIVSTGLPGCVPSDPVVCSGTNNLLNHLPARNSALIIINRVGSGFAYVIFPSNQPASVHEPFAGRVVQIYLLPKFSLGGLRKAIGETCAIREQAYADERLDMFENRQQRGQRSNASGKHPRWRRRSGGFSTFASA